MAAGRGQSLAQLAIAWTLRDPRVTSALLGASSVAQLEDNVAALDRLDLSDDELAEIDRHVGALTDRPPPAAGYNLWYPSPNASPPPPRAPETTAVASSRTCSRCSVPRKLSA